MTKLELLKLAPDRRVLAHLLGFNAASLAYIVYKKPAAAKYYSFDIPKRSGGVRTINAPADDLKKLQSRVADLLQDCISDINSGRKISGAIAHGFRRNRSIITNARCHRAKRHVFNIDLEGFFDSINFGRVRGFFLKNRNFELQDEVATTLAQIACHNNSLPQGSPCSPVISNLVAHVLDIRLAKLAAKYGCDYSRYADDLTFSTNRPRFPPQIARPTIGEMGAWEPGDELSGVIHRSGFNINPAKTRLQYRRSRQDVTGLVVNKKVNVRAEYERSARAMTHRLLTTGGFYITEFAPDPAGAVVAQQMPGTHNQLQGIWSFIDNIKRSNWTESSPRPDKRVGFERTYRDFLFFVNFYASDKPVVLLEGKTDDIYLKSAIKSLIGAFPELAEKKGNEIDYKVRFMSYTGTTARMLNLAGGTGDLKNLMCSYKREWKKCLAGHRNQPVILLIDNDDGSKGLFSAATNVKGASVIRTDAFTRICHNLYVVPTPLTLLGGHTMIEDFFPKAVRHETLNGKKFNPGKTFDAATEYGKYLFAEKIVRANQAKIDFRKFEPILKRLVAAVQDYASHA